MREEPFANSPAVDIWTICWIICWPGDTYKTACCTRLRPSPSGWRRRLHKQAQTFKVRWLRHHLLMPCFQTGWWNHEKPVCPRPIRQNVVRKESVANRHSCREGDWLQLGISAGAAAASRDVLGYFGLIFFTLTKMEQPVFLKASGAPFYPYIWCKNNQNSTFQLSIFSSQNALRETIFPSSFGKGGHQCFYCCKQRQP